MNLIISSFANISIFPFSEIIGRTTYIVRLGNIRKDFLNCIEMLEALTFGVTDQLSTSEVLFYHLASITDSFRKSRVSMQHITYILYR
jgi:hypothetical protein